MIAARVRAWTTLVLVWAGAAAAGTAVLPGSPLGVPFPTPSSDPVAVVAVISLRTVVTLTAAWLVVALPAALLTTRMRATTPPFVVRLLPPAARRAARVALGVTIGLGPVWPAGPVHASPAPAGGGLPPVPIETLETGPVAADGETATLRRVRAEPSPAPAAPPTDVSVHVVAPGESFWSIADDVVSEWPAATDLAGLTRYWQQLIDANRDRLVDPGNPDLLHPGQELVLPPAASDAG